MSRADHPLRARRSWKYWTRPTDPQPQPRPGQSRPKHPSGTQPPGRAEIPLEGESRAVIGALPIARSTLKRQIHPENTLRLPKTALRGTPPSESIPGGTICQKCTNPATTSTVPWRSCHRPGHSSPNLIPKSANAGQSGSPTRAGSQPPRGSSGRAGQSRTPSEQGEQKDNRSIQGQWTHAPDPCPAEPPNTPVPRPPVLGSTGELNPSTRVTAGRRWTFHRRLFLRAVSSSTSAKVPENN